MKSKYISSITKGPRQSNFELLRIIAMFMVLVLHADFLSLGFPTTEDFKSKPLLAVIKTFIEVAAIVSVNVFVLISGWFGLKPSLKGFCNFIFQCAYFLIGTFIVFLCLGQTQLTIHNIWDCLATGGGQWFIVSYIGLYILSPILNSFIETAPKKTFLIILISFFLFQTFYGWIASNRFISSGYSTFSFIGLYLLSRYLKIYYNKKHCATIGGGIYLISTLATSFLYYCQTIIQPPFSVLAYVNPFVLTASVGLIIWFANLKIKPNRVINWVAASAFAVYLFHLAPLIFNTYYVPCIRNAYENYNGIAVIGIIFLILIGWFMFAIILDQPRKWIWNQIVKRWFKTSQEIN